MKFHPIKHGETGSVDRRYSIERELTGKATPQYVARFCGEFIGSSSHMTPMVLRCVCHNSQRLGALVFTAIEQ